MTTNTTDSVETPQPSAEDTTAAAEPTAETAETAEKTDSATEEKPEPTEEAASPGRRRLSRATILTVAVLVALAAAVASSAYLWVANGSLSDGQSARDQIKSRAGEFGKAMLSYNYTDTKAARERVVKLASTDFAKTYETAFTGELEGVITKLQATATAAVRDVYVNDIDSGRAKAIAVMDSEVHSSTGTRRVVGSYLEMELIQQRGEWRVNGVSSIGAISETMTKPDGTTIDPNQDKVPLPGTKP